MSTRTVRAGAAIVRFHRQNETAMVIVIVLVSGLVSVPTCHSDRGSNGEIPSSKRDSDGNWHCVSSWLRFCPHVKFVL